MIYSIQIYKKKIDHLSQNCGLEMKSVNWIIQELLSKLNNFWGELEESLVSFFINYHGFWKLHLIRSKIKMD